MKNIKNIINKIKGIQQIGLIAVIIIMCVAAGLTSDVFFTFKNWINILTQASMAGITALGTCMLLLTGELDLSIGSMMAVIGVASVAIVNSTGSVPLAIFIAILIGMVLCAINATIVLKLKVNSFIATLGTMAIFRGAIMIATNAASVQNIVTGFDVIGTGYVWEIPIPVIILVVLTSVVYFILNHTPFGREVFAVGSNKEAASLSGINIHKVKYLSFIAQGFFVGVAALIMASRLNSGQPNAGTGFELNVISAVILGGVSMTGGRGKLSGALLGILILNILSNALTLLNISSFYQQIARGIVLILAVYFDEKRRIGISKQLLRDSNE